MAEINIGARPSQLGHVGFGTSKFEEMRDWWQTALGAHVVHENGGRAAEFHSVWRPDESPSEGGISNALSSSR